MRIVFSDLNVDVYHALAAAFHDDENVEVHQDDIFAHKAEAIVSPANSFACMDGGIDLVYSKYFGWELSDSLKKLVREEYEGELLVGQAAVVPTNDASIPYCISAPTMRVPMNIQGTINAYLAFRAALRLAIKEDFSSILSPGLGTMVGKLDPKIAAGQMKIAYLEVTGTIKFDNFSIRQAYNNHHLIVGGLVGAF